MLITKINYSTLYLEYRGVDTGTRAGDVKMEIRELHQFKNEDRVNFIQIICQCVGVYGKLIM